jgi:hypothetical protein
MIFQGPEPPLDPTIQQTLLCSGPYRKTSQPLPPVGVIGSPQQGLAPPTTRPTCPTRPRPPLPPKPPTIARSTRKLIHTPESLNSPPATFLLSVETAIVGGDGSMQLVGNTEELSLNFDNAVPPFPTNLTKRKKTVQTAGFLRKAFVYPPYVIYITCADMEL